MIKFSSINQAFYDLDLNYPSLPDDLVEVTAAQYNELLGKINSGCIVFSDLTVSAPKPSQFHIWNGSDWVDNRTEEEKRAAYLASFPVLSKRKFNLYLFDNNLKDEVDALLNANQRVKIEFDSSDTIERNSSTVQAMIALLGWTDEQVEQMWNDALLL